MNQVVTQHEGGQVAATGAQSSAIMDFIQRAASDASVDIDKLERLIIMSERMQAKSAEQAFNASMAQMQSEIPTVAETGMNSHTKNSYATLDDINYTMRDIMRRHGFAIMFKVEHTGAGINVTGILTHSAGHREQTSMLLPIDTGSGRNAVQAVGSSTTYGKRYVMCALLNITTGDPRDADDDGQGPDPEPTVTEMQARQLTTLLAKCSQKAQDAFNKLYPDVGLIERKSFDTVLNQLSASAKKNEPAQEPAQ